MRLRHLHAETLLEAVWKHKNAVWKSFFGIWKHQKYHLESRFFVRSRCRLASISYAGLAKTLASTRANVVTRIFCFTRFDHRNGGKLPQKQKLASAASRCQRSEPGAVATGGLKCPSSPLRVPTRRSVGLGSIKILPFVHFKVIINR